MTAHSAVFRPFCVFAACAALLVTADRSGPMTFADAEDYCSNLILEDLQGWRLPRIGELGTLMKAEFVDRGFYWSATPADTFGDEHLAAWGRRRGTRVVTRTKDSFVVCVRGDRVAK
jgi:hypothetical protein